MVGQCLREANRIVAHERQNKSIESQPILHLCRSLRRGGHHFSHDCASRKTLLPDLAEPRLHTRHRMRAVKITNLCTQLRFEIASSVQRVVIGLPSKKGRVFDGGAAVDGRVMMREAHSNQLTRASLRSS